MGFLNSTELETMTLEEQAVYDMRTQRFKAAIGLGAAGLTSIVVGIIIGKVDLQVVGFGATMAAIGEGGNEAQQLLAMEANITDDTEAPLENMPVV